MSVQRERPRGWFWPTDIQGYQEVLETLRGPEVKGPVALMEIGVWLGRSTSVALDFMEEREDAVLVVIDPYVIESRDGLSDLRLFHDYVARRGMHHRLRFVHMKTHDPLMDGILDGYLGDLGVDGFRCVMIDGDHNTAGVLRDLELCLPRMASEGPAWLCGHDINMESVRKALEAKGIQWTETGKFFWSSRVK